MLKKDMLEVLKENGIVCSGDRIRYGQILFYLKENSVTLHLLEESNSLKCTSGGISGALRERYRIGTG